MKSYHVGVAAEAFVAAVCAQAGFGVSVQYGANQPEYDLIVKKGSRFLPLSVKGSQDWGWGLCQNYKRGRTYHDAIEMWCVDHDTATVFALVQFGGVAIGNTPRIYLATPREIADVMKASRNGAGNTVLLERYEYQKGVGRGSIDVLPEHWRFSVERLEQLLAATA